MTAVCEGQGGNPDPVLSLYLGSDQLMAAAQRNSTSVTFLASPEQDGMVVLCRAQNDVMDSPVEALAQLEVLCTYGIILLYCYFKLQLYTLQYDTIIKKCKSLLKILVHLTNF